MPRHLRQFEKNRLEMESQFLGEYSIKFASGEDIQNLDRDTEIEQREQRIQKAAMRVY